MTFLHYSKRELETEFVHRFSNATMPIRNLPKNCFHYWVLGGVFVAYPLYSPKFAPIFGQIKNPAIIGTLMVFWALSEISNLVTHVILRNLRPPGTKERNIPNGFGFNMVSCPNYFFEILGWVFFSVLTGSVTAWIFTVIGAVQMYFWALKKHSRYRKDFKNYPSNRKALVPYLI
jgi:very-long-chain enoyl-CoA reductase